MTPPHSSSQPTRHSHQQADGSQGANRAHRVAVPAHIDAIVAHEAPALCAWATAGQGACRLEAGGMPYERHMAAGHTRHQGVRRPTHTQCGARNQPQLRPTQAGWPAVASARPGGRTKVKERRVGVRGWVVHLGGVSGWVGGGGDVCVFGCVCGGDCGEGGVKVKMKGVRAARCRGRGGFLPLTALAGHACELKLSCLERARTNSQPFQPGSSHCQGRAPRQ